MKRRTIFLLPMLAFASRLVAGNSPRIDADNDTLSVLHELLSIIDFPQAAGVLGKSYLAENANLTDPQLLLFNMGIDEKRVDKPIDSFENQRQLDFQTGNTVIIDGWVLSKAEVSLCCAASLLHSKS